MKIEGAQSIPAALALLYTQSLNLKRPDGTIQKHGPWKYPDFQKNGSKVSVDQLAQRTRFLKARDDFAKASEADRERWYAAAPEWNSLLWYYNYFIMSSLAGNANDSQGGVGVVKSIQFVSKAIAVSGDTDIDIDTVDPAKTVAFLFGNSFISDTVQRGASIVAQGSSNNHALSPSVNLDKAEASCKGMRSYIEIQESGQGEGQGAEAYVSALTTSQITISAVAYGGSAIGYNWQVVERKAQTVYPYPKEITASKLTLAWPIEPDEIATIGAIVIEYI